MDFVLSGSSVLLNLPKGPPAQWTGTHLLEHGKAAMTIEFATIPLYLYAAYSIIPDNGESGTKARSALLGKLSALFINHPAISHRII